MPLRLAFVTSTPLDVVRGSGTFHGIATLARALEALGCEPVEWTFKTDCCGASLMFTRLDIFKQLIGKILVKAKETGADCVVAGCSMCQMNLDTRQADVEKDLGRKLDLPVLYYTELMGLAMGHRDAGKWLKRHFVDPTPMLSAKGLL